MISLSRHAGFMRMITAAALMLALAFSAGAYRADAAAETVTLVNGEVLRYGAEPAATTVRWVSHVNGEVVDEDEVPGSTRSYAYCVQPKLASPYSGTYDVAIVDDDDSGSIALMRKLIYYLPGSYGYVKVTQSRWFGASNTTGAHDFALGHMALSYIYAGYPDDEDFWEGTYDGMKPKIKSMISDLANLPDPPERYEVFWIKISGGMQDIFGAFYSTEYGMLNMKKASSIEAITAGNANYSLEGAQYTVYEDSACTIKAKTRSGSEAVLTTGAGGVSNTLELETGKYFLKETKAPKGYATDTDVHSIEVMRDTTTTYSAVDKPKSNPVDLLLQKADKETGKAKPQGGASLEGAEYTVTYYDAAPPEGKSGDDLAPAVSGRTPARIGGKSAVWVFRTDEEGRVMMNDPEKYLVKEKSAELYRDSSGRPVFPIGIITVKESAAPEGYELDEKTYYAAVTDSGQSETLSTLKTFTGASSLKEQVIRGDVKFIKSAEGRRRMGGVLFRFTSLTTGESHVLVTDRNGLASTASEWNRHSKNTNAGKTAEDGVWFNGYNSESEGAKTEDSLGALPYDTYKMEELRCEANKGYELLSDEITIERPRVVVDLGTYDDEKTPDPVIETKARDDESGSKTAVADSRVIIVDEVSYSGVPAGRTYTMEGVLMDKATGRPIEDERGGEVRGSTEFYAEADKGTIEVRFEMDASSLGGRDAVVYEYLKKDGELVVAHADINNKKQTVKLEEAPDPEITTKARDGESGGGKAVADKDVWIIDTVEYKNLTPGETYVLSGMLMDKETGRPLRNDAGDDVCAAAEFIPDAANGSFELSFRFSGEKLAGKDAVAFEYLFLKSTGAQVASHEDINSRSQTVRLTPASPETGDTQEQLLYCLTAMAAAIELVVLTLRRRNDRLNRDIF